jgi:branched-chain amino acid transport system ATP-binding protein
MAKKTDSRPPKEDMRGSSEGRRLFEQVERLEGKILMAQETIKSEQKWLDERRQNRVDKLNNRLNKGLYQQEFALLAPQQQMEERWRQQLPARQEQDKLAYRKLRQDLRRQEGLVDEQGRLKEGAPVLSPAAQQQLDAFKNSQEEAQQRDRDALLKQAQENQMPPAQRQKAEADFKAALDAKNRKVQLLNDRLSARNTARFQAFRTRQEALIAKLTAEMTEKKRLLMESEQHARHTLPEGIALSLRNLCMTFGGLKAVDDLSFDVRQGEIFGLIGPNGAGKTTVFNCITQFYKPTSGQILYRSREGNVLMLNDYPVHGIITKGIVRTFQNVEVIGELSILENLLIAAHPQFRTSLFAQMFNTRHVRQEERVLRERAMRVLEYCGLTALKDYPPVGQPYGILKRIELARTLMAGANLIILDEPAAGLNDQETVELTHMIRRIRDEFNVTIFVVEHNMGLIMDICDHICAISFGKKLAYGTPAEIQNDPAVQEAYLGTNDTHELEVV